MPKHTSRVFGDGSRGECEALVAAARSLGEGRLEVRVNIAATSAFHPAAEALNAMAERVAAMVVGQREHAAAACHELRHPLMRLRFRHALVRGAAGREERDQNLDRMAAGFGMGLAIVRRVARRHGGSASVSESPLGGARFTLSW
jgi:signal transduction histidine kinase